ncbi:MAG: bifunctional UDP-sugar hydrolase/5'-nucleotidase UshA [Pseudomonadota bacterium]
MHKLLYVSAVSLAVLMGCSGTVSTVPPAWDVDRDYRLTILHTNDHHGRFWPNRHGEYGLAARKTLVDRLRAEVAAEGGSVLLLSGGDINTGVPESDLQNAEPDFKGMSMLGYDAMAIGNHEFDNPLSVLDEQQGWANFPMLSANIYDESGDRRYQAYEIFEKQGLKIAVIGLTTEDTARIGNPEYISELEFRDPKPEAATLITQLRAEENPDIVLAVTHMGHYVNAFSGINAPGDVALARYLEPGMLDLIVGGHSQEPVCMVRELNAYADFKPGDVCQPDRQNGTWIVQAHEWGKYVGRVDLVFRNGELALENYELIPVNLKKKVTVNGESTRVHIQDEIEADTDVAAFLAPYQARGEELIGFKVGSSTGRLEGDRNKVRFGQTNLGRLIATAQAAKARADFGVMNSGGVRASIEAGDISYRDVLTVHPFGNSLTYTSMTGSEVVDYLNVVAAMPVDSGAYAQFAGISMTVTPTGVRNVVIGGEPLDPKRTYRFTVPSFNAAGGDGYPKLIEHPGYVDTGFVDADVLKEFIEVNSPVDPASFEPAGEIVYR